MTIGWLWIMTVGWVCGGLIGDAINRWRGKEPKPIDRRIEDALEVVLFSTCLTVVHLIFS